MDSTQEKINQILNEIEENDKYIEDTKAYIEAKWHCRANPKCEEEELNCINDIGLTEEENLKLYKKLYLTLKNKKSS